MDKLGRLEVEQLKVTSTTPPADSGLYKIDETTMGVVGDLKFRHPKTGAMSSALTATTSAQGIEIAVRAANFSAYIPYVLSFPDFAPSVLASFVNGTTAAQVGNTVTVTAPAHGIVGSTAKNGYRIYYPGSQSIPAGWYGEFAWVSANTVTFQRAEAATVASESVNGGTPFTSQVTFCSLTLPGGSMGPNGRITLASLHSGDTTAGSKVLRIVLGGSISHVLSLGSTPSWWSRQTVINNGIETKQLAPLFADGVASGSALSSVAINTALDTTVAATVALGAASSWASLDSVELEVLKR